MPFRPMLASMPQAYQTLDKLMGTGEWDVEPKIDGVRVIVQRTPSQVRLWTRNGNDISAAFPEVTESIRATRPQTFVLDGELTLVDDNLPLSALLGRVNTVKGAVRRAIATPAWVQAFDALQTGTTSLLSQPLAARRDILTDLVSGMACDAVQQVTPGTAQLMTAARAAGKEGVVAKRLHSIYAPTVRTRSWLKFKHRYTLTCIAYELTVSDSPGRPFRSVILALIREASIQKLESRMVIVGEVGTGFTLTEMQHIATQMSDGLFPVLEISVMGRTATHGLREPVFVGFRTDLPLDAVSVAQLAEIPYV